MRVLRWMDKHFEEVLMSVTLIGVVVFMAVHVFFRYVLKSPLSWTEECTRYLFIWFTFSGIGYGIKNASHIRVNIIESFWPQVTRVFVWIQDIVTLSFLVYMIPAGLGALDYFYSNGITSPGMRMPSWILYFSLFFGLIMGVIRMIQRIILRVTKRNITDKEADAT